MNIRFLSLLGLLGFCGPACAAITLAPLFTDHAVLQREKPVPVWGKAAPGEKITVEFNGQKKEVTADQEGRWRVALDAMPANAVDGTLRVAGSSSPAVELHGVLVGEVWFASGQSNMQHVVSKCLNPREESAAANYPQIRMFKVWFSASETPQEFFTGKPAKWAPCQPTNVGSFGGVAYFFARDIYQKLKVPVGVINSSWGGTQIESWMSEATLKASPYQPKIAERWKKFLADYEVQFARYQKNLQAWEEAEKKKTPDAKSTEKPREPQGAVSRWTPSGLFNAMVHPLMPYALRGIVWYQGEANTQRYDEYGTLFKAMITDWRKDFGQGDIPFYFVQIANYDLKADATRQTWAYLREAQLQALSLPNTGVAITVDIGEPEHAHYANKQEAGRRLAALALSRIYQQDIEDSGPVFDRVIAESGRLRVSFKNGKKLVLKPDQGDSFEVAGADKVFHPAKATIDGQGLLVSAPDVSHPIAVRYAWHNAPATSLFDESGLPAVPFRSDDWTPPPPANAAAGVPDNGDAAN